ncbi:MAG: TadE/TadG family type IV pilus assembly protein [Aestuariivirga sp.]|uniref:TadE/TadG family type IV pilus assembly protein n=1 Tax=Aestuariivirga sp. TaxID=2650926 RepID=UPI0038D20CF3
MRKFRRSESAATAVEFALVAAPLLFLLFAIIEVSLMLAAQHQLQSATDAISRLIRSGKVTAEMQAPQFRAKFCSQASLLSNCEDAINIDLRSAPRFSDLAQEMPDPLAVGPQTPGGAYQPSYQTGGPEQPGSLIVTYDWQFFGPLDMFGNLPEFPRTRRLSGLAVYKNGSF